MEKTERKEQKQYLEAVMTEHFLYINVGNQIIDPETSESTLVYHI